MDRSAITVRIPSPLRACCGGATSLAIGGASVRAIFAELEATYPELYRSVCDETGSVRRHVGVFVNSARVQGREALDSALAPGDVVSIFQAVSGG